MTPAPVVVGLGEVLWDVFPDAAHFGGAPANFACHAASLGAESWMVSAVGEDAEGRRALERLTQHGVRCEAIAGDALHATGRVLVQLDAAGQPAYEICENVAWDHLPWSAAAEALAARCDAVCFGSLALRAAGSRDTIRRFLGATRAEALRVFDVNLRQHFYNAEIIRDAFELANATKLNDAELPVVARLCGLTGAGELELVAALAGRFDLALVALTRGARGALLYARGAHDETIPPPTSVADTVGAGDAFTAALVLGALRGLPLPAINRHACAIASFVCSQRGATPPLPEALREVPSA